MFLKKKKNVTNHDASHVNIPLERKGMGTLNYNGDGDYEINSEHVGEMKSGLSEETLFIRLT